MMKSVLSVQFRFQFLHGVDIEDSLRRNRIAKKYFFHLSDLDLFNILLFLSCFLLKSYYNENICFD